MYVYTYLYFHFCKYNMYIPFHYSDVIKTLWIGTVCCIFGI